MLDSSILPAALRLDDEGLDFVEQPGAPWFLVQGRAMGSVLYAVASPMDLLVSKCGPTMVCLDEESGARLAVPTEFRVESLQPDGDWYFARWHDVQGSQGLLRLPCSLGGSVEDRIRVRPEGYVPKTVELGELFVSGAPLSVSFQAGTTRAVLLEDLDGRPYAGDVLVRGGATGGRIAQGLTSARGLGPRFVWEGGAVQVELHSGFGGLLVGDEEPMRLTLTHDELAKEDVVPLTVPVRVGDLEVLSCPVGSSPVLARHESGVDFTPTMTDGAKISFDGVPPGDYAVGPIPWLESLWDRRHYGSRDGWVAVPPGGKAWTQWEDAWFATEAMEGRVMTSGEPPGELLLCPLYGPVASATPLGLRMIQIPLDSDGRYRIPEGAPVPSLVLVCAVQPVCSSFGSRRRLPIQVLDAIPPGADVNLRFGSVELTWPDDVAWEGPVDISFQLGSGRFDDPRGPLAAQGGEQWAGSVWASPGSFTLHGLLSSPATLTFQTQLGSRWDELVVVRLGDRIQHQVQPR